VIVLIPFSTVKKVVKKVEDLLRNLHSCPLKIDSLEKWTIFFVLEKSSTTLGAVKALRKADFNTDALALSRSVIENLANLTYLFDKPEERLELFLKYEYIEKYQALKEFENDFPAEAISEELREEINENYHKYKNLFPNKFSWSGKSVVKMLSACSFHTDFAMAYKMSSRYLHTSLGSLNNFIESCHNPCDKKLPKETDFQKLNRDDGDLALLISALAVFNLIELFFKIFCSELPPYFLQAQEEISTLVSEQQP
jgi:hypothetical protein